MDSDEQADRSFEGINGPGGNVGRKPELPNTCPYCSGQALYVRRVSSAGGQGPYFLAGLGEFLHYAEFDVVVCADCGLTQFFAEPLAQRNVRDSSAWDLIRPASDLDVEPDSPADVEDDTSEETRCLGCGAIIPAGMNKCPNCGWTYKGAVADPGEDARPWVGMEDVQVSLESPDGQAETIAPPETPGKVSDDSSAAACYEGKSTAPKPPKYKCLSCGADFPPDAKACPKCECTFKIEA